MTAHPQDRERLAKMLHAEYEKWNRGEAVAAWTGPLADALLAAGVTLPPAHKPPLLTDQEVGDLWDIKRPAGWARWDSCSPSQRVSLVLFATAAAEAAIRGRLKHNGDHRHYGDRMHAFCNDLEAAYKKAQGWEPVNAVILALFGLEGE